MDVKLPNAAISTKPLMATHAEGDEVLGEFLFGHMLENDRHTITTERRLFSQDIRGTVRS